MDYSKTKNISVILLVVFTVYLQSAFAQEFDLTLVPVDESQDLYRAQVTLEPISTAARDGASNDSTEDIYKISLEFVVQLGHSNSWLVEKDPTQTITEEEIFIRDLFLAMKNATSLEDLRDYLDDDFYRERQERYSRDEAARDREMSAFRALLDIRLLAVVRYGEFYQFLTTIKRPSEEIPEVSLLFFARQEHGKFLSSNPLSRDVTPSFFRRPGNLPDAIHQALEQYVE